MIPAEELQLLLAAKAQGLLTDQQMVEVAHTAGTTGEDPRALMSRWGLVDEVTLAALGRQVRPSTLAYGDLGHGEHDTVQPDLSMASTMAPEDFDDPSGEATLAAEDPVVLDLGGSDTVGPPEKPAPDLGLSVSSDQLLALAPDGRAFNRRYTVTEELGRGGAGVVMAADDRLMGRQVAVKILSAAEAPTRMKARFFAEAQTTAQLEHPSVVPVYEIGTCDDGRPYFAMERVRGRSLKELLEALNGGDAALQAEFTRFRMLQLFSQVCLGVDYAHAKGVIHRDLKPDNIMIGDFGEALVMDWGIAKILDEGNLPLVHGEAEPFSPTLTPATPISLTGDSAQTQAGAIFGTPGYMAPEQATGDVSLVDRRTDVWALGAVLYEILTGSSPHAGATPLAILMATVRQPVVPPRQRAPEREVPPDLEEICLRALQREREARYPTARALYDDIERYLNGARENARRTEEAQRLVQEGEETLWYTGMIADELAGLTELLATTPPPGAHAPQEEKRARWEKEDRQAWLEKELAEAHTWAERKFTQALEHVVDHSEARGHLARMHWDQYRRARDRFDALGARRHINAVARYDDGDYQDRLAQVVPLSLETNPPGAKVTLYRYVDRDRQLVAMQPRVLGQTPLKGYPLPVGRVLLEITAPGHAPARLPVTAWQGDELSFEINMAPKTLEEAGFVMISGGSFLRGHDPQAVMPLPSGLIPVGAFAISKLPVTCAEYQAFLDDLSPELARQHVPQEQEPLWRQDEHGRWLLPEEDEEGDRWLPDWPVLNVNVVDAEAYCAWRTARTGWTHRLPTESEWEKAARGTDGRVFPWGDHFDPTFCCIRGSAEGPPTPQPVGKFASDISPYGVHDMAGGVREWTSSWFDEHQRAIRGGSWNLYAFLCHPAGRFGQYPTTRLSSIGFRVVIDLDSVGQSSD
ncbi:MAG: SUMF1/EgtB/PvdO family nonheme iron enzyme [Bradymonadia bacterium]